MGQVAPSPGMSGQEKQADAEAVVVCKELRGQGEGKTRGHNNTLFRLHYSSLFNYSPIQKK